MFVGDTHVVEGDRETGEYLFHHCFSCTNCRKLLLGELWSDPGSHESIGQDDYYWERENASIKWLPAFIGGRVFEDVPTHIASAAKEAYECRSIRALRASILLARGVVEATAKDQGVTEGTLFQKIDAMFGQGIVRSFTRDAAHELRYLGNSMAHGDFVDAVDPTDTDAVLEVMSEILNEVYQGPARVSKMRARRTAAAPS